jgi:hypothetical protein
MLSCPKEGALSEGFSEHDVGENIWVQQRRNLHHKDLRNIVFEHCVACYIARWMSLRLGIHISLTRLIFSIDLIFQPHYGPWVDSASNRNEYQKYS